MEQLLQQAVAAHQAGQLQAAVDGYRRVLANEPEQPVAIQLLGMALSQLEQYGEALPVLKQATAIAPDSAEAHYNLGHALVRTDQCSEALIHLQKAIELKPALADAWLRLAEAFEKLDRLKQSLAVYEQATAHLPNSAAARHNFGCLLLRMERVEDAITQLRQAVAIDGDYLLSWQLFAELLEKEAAPAEAVHAYQQWVRLEPTAGHAHFRLASMLQAQGKSDEAVVHFEAAAKHGHDPYASNVRQAIVLPIIYSSKEQIDQWRSRLHQSLDSLHANASKLTCNDPNEAVDATLFHLVYQGKDDLPIQTAMADFYAKTCPALTQLAPHLENWSAPHSRIHVGVASSNLHNHTIGIFMLNVLKHFDRSRFHLTVFRPKDKQDEIASQIEAAADEVIHLSSALSDARTAIADSKLDLLLYPDIGMHPLTYFLCFARLAPVQCVWWGHPITTGIPAADYYLSCDRMEPADGESHYSERLVRLPTQACYPRRPTNEGKQLPRSHWGFGDDLHLYVCGQSLFKLHPDFDPILKRILEQDEKARIVLFEQREPNWKAILESRFSKTLGSYADRIIFMKRQSFPAFLQLLAQAEVILDPPHFTGGNTTYQAMGFGQPIVTLPGQFMRSRITYGAYDQMGFTDCVAKDVEDYALKAVRIATNRDYKQAVSRRINESSDCLFENLNAVREMESFFEKAVADAASR